MTYKLTRKRYRGVCFMSRTSDSVTAVSNDAYRNNSFWDKAKRGGEVETKTESTERSGDGTLAKEHASSDRVGSACGADRNKNNGDDE